MQPRANPILELGNHAKARQILRQLAGALDFGWYDAAVFDVARRWVLLGECHLRNAKARAAKPREWRALVSRTYYAAYNVSRSVRYVVTGSVRLDVKDHQEVGELPDDFPDRALWSTFLVDLRKDRNLADYEPWKDMRMGLSHRPSESVRKVAVFIRTAKAYLRGRGVQL